MKNRQEFHNHYNIELIELFDIFCTTLHQFYPKETKNLFESELAFHNFSKLIYHCQTNELI